MPVTYSITLPKQAVWEAQRASQLAEQLLNAFDSFILRIVATNHSIEWQIVDLLDREPVAVETAIRASYPDASIEVGIFEPYKISDAPIERIVVPYRLVIPEFVAPILHVDAIHTPDPLAALTQTMASLLAGEQIIYTVFVAGYAKDAYEEGKKLTTRQVYEPSILGMLFPQTVNRYIPEDQKVLDDKLNRALYQCFVMTQIDTPYPERLSSLLVVDNPMVHFTDPRFNGICWYGENGKLEQVVVTDDKTDLVTSAMGQFLAFAEAKKPDKSLINRRKALRLILEPREIAALWHLPHQEFSASRIVWMKAAQVEMPAILKDKRDGVCLGVNPYRGREEPVYQPDEDRTTHSLVIGKNGTGKSNFLHQLIHQDIARGKGLAVIDPHGALVDSVIECSIPTSREKDVVLIDLANEDYPLPLNPMRGLSGEIGLARVVNILNNLYPELQEMPQTADALENAMLTLTGEDKATLRDVNRLFLDDAYRQQVLSQTTDDVALEYWQEDFGGMTASQQRQISAPVVRRIRMFYRNPYLRPIICHPDGLDIAQLIRERKILLVSLKANEEHIPEREQQLIGSLMLARLQMAAMSGAAQKETFHVYVDEVQRFVNSPLERMFSEARKFNLSLTVSNQYMKQLSGGALEAILGNIGALIAFQAGGDDDAREIAHYTRGRFSAEDLLNLDRFKAAVWMRYHGEQQPAFSLSPLKPLMKPVDARRRASHIRQLSIQQYTPKGRADVLNWLNVRYGQHSDPSDGSGSFYDPLAQAGD